MGQPGLPANVWLPRTGFATLGTPLVNSNAIGFVQSYYSGGEVQTSWTLAGYSDSTAPTSSFRFTYESTPVLRLHDTGAVGVNTIAANNSCAALQVDIYHLVCCFRE